jgi:hypothetical protein
VTARSRSRPAPRRASARSTALLGARSAVASARRARAAPGPHAPRSPADPDRVLARLRAGPVPAARAEVAGGLAAAQPARTSRSPSPSVEAAGVGGARVGCAPSSDAGNAWCGAIKLNPRGLSAEPPAIPAAPGSSLPPRREPGRGPALSWELYVYDPGQASAPRRALPTVAAAVADHLRLPPRPARLPPHHMWSLELDAAGLAAGVARRLTVYIQGDHAPWR